MNGGLPPGAARRSGEAPHPRLIIVAAVAANGVIGSDNGLPWHIPEDLIRFKASTVGFPVVMGRLTWESLPSRFRPLPGRRNVVVTQDGSYEAPGAELASSLAGALARLADEERVFVIGGARLFAEAIPLADELQLTELDDSYNGDVRFPEWDRQAFEETSREQHVSRQGPSFSFVRYLRRR